MYIQKMRLNDKPLDNYWFYHKDFAKSGILELWLGSQSNIVKKELKISLSLGEILQILSIVLFEKVPIIQVLPKNLSQNEIAQFHNQLIFFKL